MKKIMLVALMIASTIFCVELAACNQQNIIDNMDLASPEELVAYDALEAIQSLADDYAIRVDNVNTSLAALHHTCFDDCGDSKLGIEIDMITVNAGISAGNHDIDTANDRVNDGDQYMMDAEADCGTCDCLGVYTCGAQVCESIRDDYFWAYLSYFGCGISASLAEIDFDSIENLLNSIEAEINCAEAADCLEFE